MVRDNFILCNYDKNSVIMIRALPAKRAPDIVDAVSKLHWAWSHTDSRSGRSVWQATR